MQAAEYDISIKCRDEDRFTWIPSMNAVLAQVRKVFYALAVVLKKRRVLYAACAFVLILAATEIVFMLTLSSITAAGYEAVAAEDAATTVISIGLAETPVSTSLPDAPVMDDTPSLQAPASMQQTLEEPGSREAADIAILAKLMWGEARGIEAESEKAAVAWCALNRFDASEGSETLLEIVTTTDQFTGYSHDNPITGNLLYLARDVYNRWEREKLTGNADGRVLPKEYLHFHGDGKKNDFYIDFEERKPWNWALEDPYPAMRTEKMKVYQPTDAEIEMMAKVLYGTARNVKSKMERAAVVWCILNRVASPLYPDTVDEVITQPGQFPAYHEENEVRKELLELAIDVTRRWCSEMRGERNVGRVLPQEYLYFVGKKRRNWFRYHPKSNRNWTWRLTDPYAKTAQGTTNQTKTNESTTE